MVLPNQIELLQLFSSFLIEAGLSSVSIKNYLCDLRHFLNFCSTPRSPCEVGPKSPTISDIFQNLNPYLDHYLQDQQATYTPKSTTNRRMASIRRFATFLSVKFDVCNVFTQQTISNQIKSTLTSNTSTVLSSAKILEQFKSSLEKEKKTHSTIKNYLSDLNHFFLWTANQTPFTTQNLLNILSESQLQAYITYLRLSHTGTSVLNRRQSSIKKLARFCHAEGYIPENPFELKPIPQRLAPLAWIERLSHKPKKAHTVSRNRFVVLYDKYNALRWTPYLNMAMLALATTAMAIFAYNQIISQARPSAAATALTPPKRQLSFQGRLTDSAGTPIVTATSITFKLYNALTGPTELYSTGTCSVTPDTAGIFNTLIGDTVCGAEITASVFTDNRDIYLEVIVGTGGGAQTLTPRQQIATVGYAINSYTLQGYPASASAVENTIPVMNNSGDIILGSASPDLKSTSGNFNIEGQSVSIKTTTSSGGSIVLQPDAIGGVGNVQVITANATGNQFRVEDVNLTSGNLISGYVGNGTATGRLLSLSSDYGSTDLDKFYVAVDGRTKINATSATGWPALTVNQTSTGDLIAASASGVAKFTVTNAGNVNIAGQYMVNGTPISTGGSNWQLTSGSLAPLQITNSVNIGATATASAKVHLAGTAGENSWINTGNVGIGTTNPTTKLYIQDASADVAPVSINANGIEAFRFRSVSATNNVIYVGGETMLQKFGTDIYYGTDATNQYFRTAGTGVKVTINDLGNVGIGDTTPASMLTVGSGDLFQVNSSGNIVKINNVTTSFPSSQGVANSVLTNDGSGILTWVSPGGSGVSGFWQRTLGSLAPTNITDSLNLGATATASALVHLAGTAGENSWINTGNVGIGTTSPLVKFEVSDNVAGNSYSYFGNIDAGSTSAAGLVFRLSQDDNVARTAGNILAGKEGLWTSTASTRDSFMSFSTSLNGAATEKVRIDSNGNVGIGTTAPTEKLHVEAGGVRLGTTSDVDNVLDTAAAAGAPSGDLYWGSYRIIDSSNMSSYGVTSVTGTANQITASPTIGAVVLSIPSDFRAPGTLNAVTSIATGAGAGTVRIDAVGNLTNIGTITSGLINGQTISSAANFTGTLVAATSLSAPRLISTVAIGTAPLTVTSTTAVTNLNADLLDGQHGAYYAPLANISGTTNYVAKFTGTNSVGNSIIFDNGTNVGIGTTSPSATLDVAGLIEVPNQLGATTANGVQYGTSYPLFIQNAANASYHSYIMHNAYLTSPSNVETFNWNTTHASYGSRGIKFIYGTAATGGISFFADNVATTADTSFTPTERMRITNGGNVGIGTTGPGYKLDVTGSVNLTGTLGIGTANPSTSRNINAAITFTDAAGYGIYNATTVTGTLTANRTNIGAFNLITSTADDASFTNNLYGSYNQVTNSNGTTYDVAYGSYDYIVNNDATLTATTSAATFGYVLNNAAGTLTNAYGGLGQVINNTTGSIGNARGLYGYVRNDEGTMTNGYGVYGYVQQNVTAGTLTNAYGGYFNVTETAGTISSGYGVYIADIGGTTQYGLYQASSTDTNYFAGNVGIGTTDPSAAKLVVAGSIFPSAGTYNLGSATYPWLGAYLGSIFNTGGTETISITNQYLANGDWNVSTGKLGIGFTTAPTNDLSFGNSAARKIWIENTASGTVGRALTLAAGSTVAGGTNIAGGNLLLQGGAGTGTGASTITFQTGTTLGSGTTLQTETTRMVINGLGNVAITSANVTGTTTSSALSLAANSLTTGTGFYVASSTLTSGELMDLQVSGTAAAASQTGLNILTTGANGTAGITTYGAQISNTHSTNTSTNVALYLNASGGATANYALIVPSTGGNVGIGTTAPSTALEVNGNISFPTGGDRRFFVNTAPSHGYNLFVLAGDAAGTTGTIGGNLYLDAGDSAGTGGSKAGNILIGSLNNYNSGGNVGIKMSTAAYPLDVTGDIRTSQCLRYNSGTLGTCTSDILLKTNIQPLIFNNALAKVNGLSPKTYKFIKEPDRQYTGLIAQDVEMIAPELVVIGDDGYKQVKYGDIQWLTIEAIQEQQTQIATLRQEATEWQASLSSSIVAFASAVIANFQAGVAVINELVADNLIVRTKLISPIADIDQLKVIDATVSGTLYADNIKGQTVDKLNSGLDLLNEKYSTASAILADLQAKYTTYDSLALSTNNPAPITDTDPLALSPLATTSATLIANDIMANGSIFAQSISSFDTDLFIQPTGDKPIHLLANLLTLYPDGKVLVNGDIYITGTIYANNLDTRTATISGTLAVGTSTIATGSANFDQLTTGGLIIASGYDDLSASISAESSSNTTIGTATIASGSAETIIANTKVTDHTLIYITPVSDTSNQVLYVKSKQSGIGFTVAVPSILTNEVSFNYWLVETK